MTTDHERKYVRKPKPESKGPSMIATRKYYGYDSDGKLKGVVKLTNDAKARHEARGYTFKPVNG